MAQRTLVIANPRSRNGATGRRWQAIEARIREVLGPVEVAHTLGPRDAVRLAHEAARAGVERILVAGGDGTLSEVATGLIEAECSERVEIGVLPLGTGGDFLRSLGAPREVEAALARIAEGVAKSVDAGRVRFLGHEGEACEACFVNVSSFGISALADELVNQTTKLFGGTLSFLVGTIRAIVQYEAEPVRILVDGECVYEGAVALATAANGRYFGGGMQVAPRARIDDGQLDVVIVPQIPVAQLLRKLPLIYRGTHLDEAGVLLHRGRVIEAQAPPGTVEIELDGEPLGTLPATWELLPGALRLLGAGSV